MWVKCGKMNLNPLSLSRAIKWASVAITAFALLVADLSPALAAKFSSVVVDARTGAIISGDDVDGRRFPASLTKMMTLYIIFQDLKAGRIKLSTPLKVSRRAASMSPSKLYLKPGSTITVEQAIKALVIKSANDAAATVGENLGRGSEAAFAQRMTRVARSIGMSRTTFKNASGLPNPGQLTTARDMATLGLRLMRDYPQYYPYFRSTSFVFKGRMVQGHNRLVGRFEGTDGIKTGYTNASGFNLVTSTKRDGKRVVGVVMGARSSGTRNAHMMTIIARAMSKAKAGNTVAAVAGSSKGIINPLVKSKQPQVAEVVQPEISPDQDKVLLAAVAAEAAIDTKEEDGENEGPQVLEATIEDQATNQPTAPTKKLPFAVKPAATKTVEETGSLPPTFTVQITGFKNKKAAQTALGNMRAVMGDSMKNTDAATIAIKKKGKTTYRVDISGFPEKAAKTSCEKAAKMGKACIIVPSQG
jgi:D-alanyl-D-alanine carboxypeptidase